MALDKSYIKTPLLIGDKKIQNRLLLAPMTGLTHIAFRELVAVFGGFGLLFTEMCSSKSLPDENRNYSPVFKWRNEELPFLVCQIFGSDPVFMSDAAQRIEQEGFFGVDVNFSCSVASICKKNAGAALLKTPVLARKIVSSIRKSVSIPVFVKFRVGWNDDPSYAADMAKQFEDAGADALTFHPRIAPDRRLRPPKWDYIRLVKKRVSIPVFGNGNVFDANDCNNMLENTGCDGVSIGRIAVSKPWIFHKWINGFMPGPDIYVKTAHDIVRLLEKHHEPSMVLKYFKKFAVYFSANFRFGHDVYSRLCSAQTVEELNVNINKVLRVHPEVSPRPNMNLFVA